MPDIHRPSEENLLGKGIAEVARLLSHASATEIIAHLNRVSDDDGEAIMGSNLSVVKSAATLDALAVADAAGYMDVIGIGRSADALELMVALHGSNCLDHANLSLSNAQDILQYGETNLHSKWILCSRTLKTWVCNGIGDMKTPRWAMGAAGHQNTPISIFGGIDSNNVILDELETLAEDAIWEDWHIKSPYIFDMNTPVWQMGSTGSFVSSLSCGGNTAAYNQSIVRTVATEVYTGFWTVKADLNTAVSLHACCGTGSAAMKFGGYIDDFTTTRKTEEYDGSSWTTVADLQSEEATIAGCGTVNAGLMSGDYYSREWNGSAWGSEALLNTDRFYPGMFGTQTAAIVFGGKYYDTDPLADTEEYNGSSWTSSGVGDMNTPRYYHNGDGNEMGYVAGGHTNGRNCIGDSEGYR